MAQMLSANWFRECLRWWPMDASILIYQDPQALEPDPRTGVVAAKFPGDAVCPTQ
jgi:hypothetical protein